MGDPAGIGLDILLAAWLKRKASVLPSFLAVADPALLSARARALRIDVPIAAIDTAAAAPSAFPDRLPVLPIQVDADIRPGRPEPGAATAVVGAIERGVDLVRSGAASALVTNPINKAVLYGTGFAYPGHTEFLGALARRAWPGVAANPVMMLACDELRVVPVTVHVALEDVPDLLSPDAIVATVETAAGALRQDFGIAAPRVAVSGLNPHAGEKGALGRQEIETIGPAIERLRAAGHNVSGPLPADAMFHARARAAYDAAVTMYHDQALIPIKTIAFERAVNVTIGLPFVRTCPDHGTAYDIAGTGKADPSSLIEALRLAAAMAARRRGDARA